MDATAGPLAGIRVIELATVVAGPGTGRYLADFGAEVIKVEAPGGDPTRRMGWTGPGETDAYFWKLANRNKKAVSLDLKTDQGKADLWRLVADAGVLIENMRPGKLEALGFSPEALLAKNPRLVILRVSGFGQDGPYAQHPGFATIAEAMSGLAGLIGEADGPPLLPPIALTDEVTALVGAFATLAAVRHAERTGEGQTVDVNLLQSMFQIMGPLVSAYAHMGYLQPRLGSGIPYTVPRGTYCCADGVWVASSSSSDNIAIRLLELIGLKGDERFASFQARSQQSRGAGGPYARLDRRAAGRGGGVGVPPRRRGDRQGLRHEGHFRRPAFQGARHDHRGRRRRDAERRRQFLQDAGAAAACRAGRSGRTTRMCWGAGQAGRARAEGPSAIPASGASLSSSCVRNAACRCPLLFLEEDREARIRRKYQTLGLPSSSIRAATLCK